MNHAIPARTRTDLEGNPMKIGELAILTHTPVETIRYYEREGLLPEAARTGGNYRIYDQAQAARLSFIRHCRGLDMTLDEIRTLLRFNLKTAASRKSIKLIHDGPLPTAGGGRSAAVTAVTKFRRLCGAYPSAGTASCVKHPARGLRA
jgi:hypothetical protein